MVPGPPYYVFGRCAARSGQRPRGAGAATVAPCPAPPFAGIPALRHGDPLSIPYRAFATPSMAERTAVLRRAPSPPLPADGWAPRTAGAAPPLPDFPCLWKPPRRPHVPPLLCRSAAVVRRATAPTPAAAVRPGARFSCAHRHPWQASGSGARVPTASLAAGVWRPPPTGCVGSVRFFPRTVVPPLVADLHVLRPRPSCC